MSSILQGLGNRVMSQVGRSNSVTPKGEKAKEERTQGATPKNYDSYEPSTIATMMMSEEVVEEDVVDADLSEDVLIEDLEEDFDVDGEDLDVDGEDMDVEEDVENSEVEDTDSTETNSRVHGYQSSLSESDRAMLEIAYLGFNTSNYSNMESLINYMSSGSNSGWFATDTTSIYDSILASLSASSSTTTDSTTEAEEETEVDEVETDVEAEVDTEEEMEESVYESAEA